MQHIFSFSILATGEGAGSLHGHRLEWLKWLSSSTYFVLSRLFSHYIRTRVSRRTMTLVSLSCVCYHISGSYAIANYRAFWCIKNIILPKQKRLDSNLITWRHCSLCPHLYILLPILPPLHTMVHWYFSTGHRSDCFLTTTISVHLIYFVVFINLIFYIFSMK